MTKEEVVQSRTINTRGNTVLMNEEADAQLGFVRGGARAYERRLTQCGWQVYRTLHDAWYFGVFVDVAGMQIMAYSDGERQLVVCLNEDSFQSELLSMAEFYGPADLDFSALNPHAKPAHRHREAAGDRPRAESEPVVLLSH